ncbi:TolC family protein [Chitinophaga oryziterrae]|nr:TolC family protein [Chitinophaga oryziterrae]
MRFVFRLLFLGLVPGVLLGQKRLSLPDVLGLTAASSIHARLIESQQELARYVFQSYRSDLRPQVSFSGNLPMYSKAFTPVTQPDGSVQFIAVEQNYSSAGFSLSQVIPQTGGRVSLNTGLNRFDDFKGDYRQYNATPVFMALSQPFMGYNAFKWASKIEPLRFTEARRSYFLELENMNVQVSDLYFGVVEAQNEVQVGVQNLADYRGNYEVEKGRVNLGTTTEDKLTQLELQILDAESGLRRSEYRLRVAKLNLRVFVGLLDAEDFTLELPVLSRVYYPDVSEAIAFAKRNRPEYVAFERRLLEAKAELAKAKAEKYAVNLSATYGLNNSDVRLKGAYGELKTQQTLGLVFDVPLLDWGRRNARIHMAKASLKLQLYQNSLDEATIVQEVTTLVENLVLLQNNVRDAEKVQALAGKRYDLAQGLYRMGKYTVTELITAQMQKDNARKGYIEALKVFWNAHYSFRKMTGFDPVLNRSLLVPTK